MKKFTFSLIAMLVISHFGMSQITFSAMADTLVLEDGVDKKAEITLLNNTATDYMISWRTLSSTLIDNTGGNNHWNMQFCECNNCYTNLFGLLPDNGACNGPLLAGASEPWYLTVNPSGNALTDAEMVVEVTNETTKEVDTITYVVLAPNSVVRIPDYGRITAFPNPASNNLTIQYALENVKQPEIYIYNTLGAMVKMVQVNGLVGTIDVNTSNLNSGMYIYVLKENGVALTTQRFNVMH